MKKSKRILAVIMTVLTVFSSIFVVTAIAGNSKTKAISESKWYTPTQGYNYKITVKKEGYLYIEGVAVKEKSYGSAYAALYVKDSNQYTFGEYGCNNSIVPSVTQYSSSYSSTVTGKIPVSAGTYYIVCNSYSSYKGLVKFRYQFKAITDTENYSAYTAKRLKEYQCIDVYQTQMNSYVRWYSFTLTSASKVTIKYSRATSLEDVRLMNCYGRSIGLTRKTETGRCYTTSKLPAGTYYISVDSSTGSITCSGIFTIGYYTNS